MVESASQRRCSARGRAVTGPYDVTPDERFPIATLAEEADQKTLPITVQTELHGGVEEMRL